MIRREVRVARKEYRCEAPFRPCDRRILRGDPYTQTSFSPGSPPFGAAAWINLRACSVCSPIPHEVTTRHHQPCGVGASDQQCSLPLDHETPHEYPIGLF